MVDMSAAKGGVYRILSSVIPARGSTSSQPILQPVDLWNHPESTFFYQRLSLPLTGEVNQL